MDHADDDVGEEGDAASSGSEEVEPPKTDLAAGYRIDNGGSLVGIYVIYKPNILLGFTHGGSAGLDNVSTGLGEVQKLE